MKLVDIASLEKWLELEQKIYERSGLNASVFDVAGVACDSPSRISTPGSA